MTPFDIHYLICLSENRTFFYWRAFAKPAYLANKNNVYARAGSIFKDLKSQSPFNFHFFPSPFFYYQLQLAKKNLRHLHDATKFPVV